MQALSVVIKPLNSRNMPQTPMNTFGQPISTGGGSIVPQAAPPTAVVTPTPTTSSVPPNTPITTNTAPVVSPDDQKLLNLGVTPDQLKALNDPSGNGLDPASFSALVSNINTKLATNNDLVTVRGNLIKHLYDSPLTPDELAKLPPDIQQVVQSGNKDAVELQLRLINDQIAGRANTLSSSIAALTTGYSTAVAQAEKQKQDAVANIQNFVQQYGDKAPAALKALYGQSYIDQLKAQGIDIEAFSKLSPETITQQRYAAQYGSATGALDVNIPSGTIASRTNNPLNIKFTPTTSGFGGTDSGIAAQDGGTFANFATPQDGLKAATQLLQSPLYNNLTLEQAMRQWSNNAYGAEVAPELDPSQKVGSLGGSQMDQLVSDMAQRESGASVTASPTMIQSIAQGIENGSQPPTLTGLYTKSGQVRAQLKKDGFNLTKATEDWNAVTKWTATTNSSTVVKAKVAADSSLQYIQSLRALSAQWDEQNPLTPLDYAHFQTALNGGLGQANQNIAQKVQTQIADLTADMASVYRYGLSTTDSSMSNAAETLSTNWDNGRLNASLDVIEPNLKVRINSLTNPANAQSAAGGPNAYVSAPTKTDTSTPSGAPADSTSVFDSLFSQYGGK